MIELTLEQARKNPEGFLYIFADEQKYLRYLDSKHAAIIRGKKANQNKILLRSEEKYGVPYEEYADAIRQSFIDNYGLTPAQILVKLANGETVAGKNYAEGSYGVGKVSNTFTGTSVSVDPTTGKILNNGVEVEGQNAIYNKKGVSCWSAVVNGKTYISNYRSVSKTFCASQVVDEEGNSFDAFGNGISSADTEDLWERTVASFEKFINWLISLFTGEKDLEKKTINPENTNPNQKKDGFTNPGGSATTEAGFGTLGTVLLASAVVGGVLYSSKGKKKSKK